MTSWLKSCCLNLYALMRKDEDDSLQCERDALMWYRELDKHSYGEYSFAVVQANTVVEDQSQVETGNMATFVGVYDGHGGPEASKYICDHLFNHLFRLAQEAGTISEEVLRNAIAATEDGFLTVVRRAQGTTPLLAAVGSCCLVGAIFEGTLYVANLGDSRAVVGYLDSENKINAEQLTSDHNASREEVRQDLMASHPNDPNIVVLRGTVWRVKGIIQISRSIGDAYLKRAEFSLGPSYPKFHLSEPLQGPVLRDDPSVTTRALQESDKFLIFASDGLWEQLSNEQAVEIVHNNPRNGIARKLIKAALLEAARKTGRKYRKLKKVERGARRDCHDDISVVVIFIDLEMLEKNKTVPGISILSFADAVEPSRFNLQKND